MNKKPECLTFKEAMNILNEYVQNDNIDNCDIMVVDMDTHDGVTYLISTGVTIYGIYEGMERNDIMLVKRNKWED